MKYLKNLKELREELANEELHPPHESLSTLNKDKTYNCGCGSWYPVDSTPIAAACRGI